jgi:predicted phosphodiesterase
LLRIAHISDLHLKKNDENSFQAIFIRLMNNIVTNKCNHLIITGDISDNSDIADLKYVKLILKKYKYTSPDNLSVTIGNHDIFGGAKKGPDVILFPTECKNTNYNSKVKKFCEVFSAKKELASGQFNKNIFLNLKMLSNEIALISVNSIAKWSAYLNPIASNGLVSKADMKRLETLLSKKELHNKFKIVLIHHHLNEPDIKNLSDPHSLWLYSERYTMKLHNKDEIIDLFDRYKVDLILHGHTHITESYKIRRSIFINSSGCIMPFTDRKLYQYHIINFPYPESNPSKFEIRKLTF